MKNLHIICTKMLLSFWRDLGIDMTREKFERIIQRKVKKGQKLQENGNYFISIIVLVSSK